MLKVTKKRNGIS